MSATNPNFYEDKDHRKSRQFLDALVSDCNSQIVFSCLPCRTLNKLSFQKPLAVFVTIFVKIANYNRVIRASNVSNATKFHLKNLLKIRILNIFDSLLSSIVSNSDSNSATQSIFHNIGFDCQFKISKTCVNFCKV